MLLFLFQVQIAGGYAAASLLLPGALLLLLLQLQLLLLPALLLLLLAPNCDFAACRKLPVHRAPALACCTGYQLLA